MELEDESFEDVDVFLDIEENEDIYLLQYPTIAQNSAMYQTMTFGTPDRESVRWKPQCHMLEQNIQLDYSSENPNFSVQRAMEFLKFEEAEKHSEKQFLDHLQFVSSEIAFEEIQPLMGFRAEDKIILKPLKGVLQMRPSFKHIHHGKRELFSSNSPTTSPPVKALQMAFKKKETDEELSARLQSFSYLQKLANEESWVPLTLRSDPADIFTKPGNFSGNVEELAIDKQTIDEYNLSGFVK